MPGSGRYHNSRTIRRIRKVSYGSNTGYLHTSTFEPLWYFPSPDDDHISSPDINIYIQSRSFSWTAGDLLIFQIITPRCHRKKHPRVFIVALRFSFIMASVVDGRCRVNIEWSHVSLELSVNFAVCYKCWHHHANDPINKEALEEGFHMRFCSRVISSDCAINLNIKKSINFIIKHRRY